MGDQQAINLLAQCSTVGEIIQHKYNSLMAASYLTGSHLLWAISWDRKTNGSHLVVDPVDPVGGINRPLILIGTMFYSWGDYPAQVYSSIMAVSNLTK